MPMTEDSRGAGVVHLDETGAPCTRHPSPDLGGLTALAVIGSRAPSFSHDVASKLQRLIMAIAELDDLAPADSVPTEQPLRIAIEAAQSALSELQTLFVEHRALSRWQVRESIAVTALVEAARLRVGVFVEGDLTPRSLNIHVPAVTHALAQLLDLVAVDGPRGRIAQISAQATEAAITLSLATAGSLVVPDNNLLALATFVVASSGGELRCTCDAVLVRLPLGTV